jgi:heme-degrading monooxygenase HmoA
VHARVSTYETDDPDGLVQGFQNVTDELELVEGFSHAYFPVDDATGRAVSITIWESEEALNASSAAADQLRARGTVPSQSQITAVDSYKIAHRAGRPSN